MAKTTKAGKSVGSGVTSKTARAKSAKKTTASRKTSGTGVRTTSSGNRRGGNTSNERISAKRPRSGAESNAGSGRQKQEATRATKAKAEKANATTAQTAQPAQTRPSFLPETPLTLRETLKARDEKTGANHARGRHLANPKQSGSGGSAQYIRRSL